MAGFTTNSTFAYFWRGNASNLGGWYWMCRFSEQTVLSGSRAFIGLATGTTGVGNSNPSLWGNSIGIGYEDSDPTGNQWSLFSNDAGNNFTKTRLSSSVSGAANRDGDTIYEFHLYSPPSGSFIGVKVLNISSGSIIYNNPIYSSTLPNQSVFLGPMVQWATGSSGAQVVGLLMHMVGQSYI